MTPIQGCKDPELARTYLVRNYARLLKGEVAVI